ncbi:MAG: DUF4157 domain-containing protein [Cyanobacteria bacterium J06638_20]
MKFSQAFNRDRSGILQRKCACGQRTIAGGQCSECQKKRLHRRAALSEHASEVPTIVQEVIDSPGQSLEPDTRLFMESHFGHDFSQVQVHTNAKAAASAQFLNALAYTSGQNVVFAAGHYTPNTEIGRKLLAHELTHVLQQRNNPLSFEDSLKVNQDLSQETQADRFAQSISEYGHHQLVVPTSSQVKGIQRQTRTSPTVSDQTSTRTLSSSCIQVVSGEEIPTLLEPYTVTIVEYGAPWCIPCQMLQDDLDEICRRLHTARPSVTVRFYSVDIDDPRNQQPESQSAQERIPQLSIYVGGTRRHHSTGQPQFEQLDRLLQELIEYAATSGAARGAVTGLAWGAAVGGLTGLGTAIGLAASGTLRNEAALFGGLGLVAGGALVGLGIGAAIGAIVGVATDSRGERAGTRVGINEADTLIRQRFGDYLAGSSGTLNNARIRPVTRAQLLMLIRCRRQSSDIEQRLTIGWTDHGPEPPDRIPSAQDEPMCSNGQRLEHATRERPIIYYATDHPNATILIHEGLHAYAHPNFSLQLRNFANEGATEYFTIQIANDIGVAALSGYGSRVEGIEQLVEVIGEEALRQAYFQGNFSAANNVLGSCGLQAWAQFKQMFRDRAAAEVLRTRGQDYCTQIRTFPTLPSS